MYPEIHILQAHIGTYGLMACIGAVAALFMASFLSRKRGYLPWDFLGGVAWIALLAVVGASLLYGITNIGYLIDVVKAAPQYPNALVFVQDIALAFGGMVFYGGMLGALLGFYLWLRRSGRTGRMMGDYLDMFAVALPLFHAFARIGCFLGGCCFGVECPVGFTYTIDPIEVANGVSRFPVQLLESACEFALFGVLLVMYNRERLRGQLVWVWAGSYGCIRFLDEFLRGDYYRGFLGPFSTSQWISLILIAATFAHYLARTRTRTSDE